RHTRFSRDWSSDVCSSDLMFQIVGIVLLFALVFGSYLISGGNMGVILHALPHEMMAIGGAGVASYLIANSMTVIKGTLGGFSKRSEERRVGKERRVGRVRD